MKRPVPDLYLYAQARASDRSTVSAPSLLTETRMGFAASVIDFEASTVASMPDESGSSLSSVQ